MKRLEAEVERLKEVVGALQEQVIRLTDELLAEDFDVGAGEADTK